MLQEIIFLIKHGVTWVIRKPCSSTANVCNKGLAGSSRSGQPSLTDRISKCRWHLWKQLCLLNLKRIKCLWIRITSAVTPGRIQLPGWSILTLQDGGRITSGFEKKGLLPWSNFINGQGQDESSTCWSSRARPSLQSNLDSRGPGPPGHLGKLCDLQGKVQTRNVQIHVSLSIHEGLQGKPVQL